MQTLVDFNFSWEERACCYVTKYLLFYGLYLDDIHLSLGAMGLMRLLIVAAALR